MAPRALLEQAKQFLKRFKTDEGLSQLQKLGLKAILNGELDTHLGYDKHEKSSTSNTSLCLQTNLDTF